MVRTSTAPLSLVPLAAVGQDAAAQITCAVSRILHTPQAIQMVAQLIDDLPIESIERSVGSPMLPLPEVEGRLHPSEDAQVKARQLLSSLNMDTVSVRPQVLSGYWNHPLPALLTRH